MNGRLILSFLRDLKKNNDREWFQAQTKRWHEAREEFRLFVESLLDGLQTTAPDWAQHTAADCVFRIHRDMRFSKDKTPYKTNVSASLGASGRSVSEPGFYVSIEPGGKSMLAAGLYQPSPGELNSIRSAIAQDATPLRKLITSIAPGFPDGINGDRSKTVRGFRPDHPAYDLIQIKSFCAWREYPDSAVLNGTFTSDAKAALASSVPLCRWIDSVIKK